MKLVSISGHRESGMVFMDGEPLDPEKSQRVRNHSPDGFGWGYGGSAPSQLALAILLEVTDKQTALKNYQLFKSEVIARISLDKPEFNRVFNLQAYI